MPSVGKSKSHKKTFKFRLKLAVYPVIIYDGWQEDYKELFVKIFQNIDINNLHSITFGKLRFPDTIYIKLIKENIQKVFLI